FNDEVLYTSFRLRAGQNDIVITASNPYGSDRELVVIHYQSGSVVTPPTPAPAPLPKPNPVPSTGLYPTVQITRPYSSPYTSNQRQYRLEASIEQVQNKGDIDFRLNGRRIYNFDWNGKVLGYTTNLETGNNSVQITAKNQRGTASDQATLIYQQPGPAIEGPKVTITRPSSSSATVGQATYLLKAQIQHVDNKNNISFTINNQAIHDFAFNAGSGALSKTLNLNPGTNTIRISATNAGGTASDQVTIQYNKPVTQQPKPPVVDITKPADNTQTDQYNLRVEAVVKEVISKSDITFLLNGKGMTNFTFNPSTDRFTADVVLREGSNQIQITGRNQDGQDSESIQVTYSRKKLPVVSITTPSSSSTVSNQATTAIKAQILNVYSKNDVRLTVNGQNIS
ncbi:MAG: hypothetical protein KDC44_22870, partial [Phaeodactylibacter sp.]|nr:hypothetical protein [Phaeodactylibacter sp.]